MNNQERKNEISCNQNKVILSLTQDLRRLSLQLVNSMRGRFQIKFGMTSLCNSGGFTLIELLVVVLIIAILSAVAVPQYRKAVLKSRFKTLYPVARSLAQAQESFYLANGEYAENLSELDVSIPGNTTGQTATLSGGTQIKLGAEENHVYVRAEKGDNALMIYQNHSPNFAGETHCEAKQDDTLANWFCEKGLEGTFIGNKFGYAIYALDATDPNSTLGRIYYNRPGGKKEYEEGDSCVATVYQGCDGNVKLKNYSACIAEAGVGCRGVQATNHSRCEDNNVNGCYGATFDNYSVCKGTYCKINNYNDHSTCFSQAREACSFNNGGWAGNFNNYSSCVGDNTNSCQETSFTDYSVCFANASGACKNATYDETSCCQGDFCTEHQCNTKPLTKNLTIIQPVYEEMITPVR